MTSRLICSNLLNIGRCAVPSTSSTLFHPRIAQHVGRSAPLRFAHVFRAPDWDFGKDRLAEPEADKIRYAEANPEKWKYLNEVVWPPGYVDEDGKALPGTVFHFWENVKYSHQKMWQVCHLIDQLPVDAALKQLDAVNRKGALIMADIIREAVAKATKDHAIEFPSNLFVAHSLACQSMIIKGRRKHARVGRYGTVKYRYCNVFVRLEEGKGPGFKTREPPPSGWDKAQEHLDDLRLRDLKYPLA